MKEFLQHLVGFCTVCCLFFGLIFVFNYFKIQNDLSGFQKKIMMGDSHIMSALDPKEFDDWTIFASYSESYAVTFQKLQWVLNSDVGVDTIILGFSPHNLSTFNDHKLYGERGEFILRNNYPAYSNLTLYSEPVSYSTLMRVLFKNLAVVAKPHHLTKMGQFVESELTIDSPSNHIKSVHRHFGKNLDFNVSNWALDYLERIVKLCIKENVHLILVGTPLHPFYRKRIPGSIQSKYEMLLSKYDTIPGVSIYSQLSMFDDSTTYFRDLDHINSFGAIKFSKSLKTGWLH